MMQTRLMKLSPTLQQRLQNLPHPRDAESFAFLPLHLPMLLLPKLFHRKLHLNQHHKLPLHPVLQLHLLLNLNKITTLSPSTPPARDEPAPSKDYSSAQYHEESEDDD